jgi:hypothetical protein
MASTDAIKILIKKVLTWWGMGPMRRPVDVVGAYLRFGDWLRSFDVGQNFKFRFLMYDHIYREISRDKEIDFSEFGVKVLCNCDPFYRQVARGILPR